MNPSKVTIVIPIFNIEHLVSRCIESVLSQSYDDLEIILVNDGSTDQSGRICDKFATVDSRIVVIHKSNGGLSDARNVGISAASGNYIACIDGDDYVSQSYIQDLIEPFETEGVDLSVISYLRVFPENFSKESLEVPGENKFEVLSNEEALRKLYLQRGITTSAWGKLYRKEHFKGLEYPVGHIHEDLPVTYKLFAKAPKIAVISKIGYFYVQHPGSITAKADFARRWSAIGFAEEAVSFTAHRYPNLRAAAEVRAFMECIYLISQIPNSSALRECEPLLHKKVKEYRGSAVYTPDALLNHKLIALVSFLGLSRLRRFLRLKVNLGHFYEKYKKLK